MPTDFDELIERRGTHSAKWDMMETLYGVPSDGGIAMWVADMDFRPPACVQAALNAMTSHGIYGYFGDDRAYVEAIRWWMRHRHGWDVEPASIFTTHGLVNGTALCIDALTTPGDAVVIMTPVYHVFSRVIAAAGREVVECPLAMADGRYVLDIPHWDSLMRGNERMMILCSPHNPGGRVWSRDELQAIAAFCERHDLILVSDEIHHDLVMPGHKHTVLPVAAPDALSRLVMLTSTTKTFNIAGAHIGNVIIADEHLRGRFRRRMDALGISPNSFGMAMATAAYSPEGAAWVDELNAYLDKNRRLFDQGVNAIAGLRSMPLEATYLAWVDFSGTGMPLSEFTRRVEQDARLAVNHGPTFGRGGQNFLRFNIATQRSTVSQALQRLAQAFAAGT